MIMDMGRDAAQETVELEYQSVEADWVTALRERRQVSKAGRRRKWWIGVMVGCAVLGAAADLADGEAPVFWGVWIAVFVPLMLLAPRLQARQLFRAFERNGTHRVTVTDAGFTAATDNATSTLNWTALPRYRETAEMFVLFGGDKNAVRFAVLPKRGLRNAEDADRLRAILDRNLSRA
ncbi:YcxB family protein [Streptomyces sp. NBC_00820]|uniref:YcxB family protein n=1 Tax=Streptomyces sp. NBC_00820 TaxID=2975842 RepID=UPI002ED575A3|nr:YcxB family protein [Streptomyces sp. NBC_00820]